MVGREGTLGREEFSESQTRFGEGQLEESWGDFFLTLHLLIFFVWQDRLLES